MPGAPKRETGVKHLLATRGKGKSLSLTMAFLAADQAYIQHSLSGGLEPGFVWTLRGT